MTAAWVPRFACPECRGPLHTDRHETFTCPQCVLQFDLHDGIYRFLTRARADAAAPFLRQYRIVREHDGYRRVSAEYYRMLPCVAAGDPRAGEWRIRRESYAHLQRHALPAVWAGPIRVLDLGAGCGWLSHRLAAFGHDVVAVDQQDDDADGLGACRHYPVSFVRIQADFDALPLASHQFDLVIFEGSLHYSNEPSRTLAESRRMLAPGGTLAVMDSPIFKRSADGRRMIAERDRRMALEHGLTCVVGGGAGFLTFAMLREAARDLGLSARFYPSSGSLQWRVRRQLARIRLGRAPAAFGTWVAEQSEARGSGKRAVESMLAARSLADPLSTESTNKVPRGDDR